MHRQKRAKFAKKQAEVGKWKHLVVSPSTDSRWAEESYFYPINERDYTHEEVMPQNLSTCGVILACETHQHQQRDRV